MIAGHATVTLGLFDKRIEGDDCLMELARCRFHEEAMGTEMYPSTADHLEALMKFRPSEETPLIVHLARDLDLAQKQSRAQILEFASRFAGRVYGLVIHDHLAMAERREQYVEAAWEMESRLGEIPRSPFLFIEYAAGLEPDAFAKFFASIQDLDRVSACIDIGHIGIREAQAVYAQSHPGEEICALKSQPDRLPHLMNEVQAAVQAGASAALNIIEVIGDLKKPVHFHLHDAHPLSNFSPFGVSDHLSFFAAIPLGFEYLHRQSIPPMFGPQGLAKVVRQAMDIVGPRGLSFTLEIHPANERLSLGKHELLFRHWTDKTNAEKTNGWLAVLAQNHKLLSQIIQQSAPARTGRATEARLAETAVRKEALRPDPVVRQSPPASDLAPRDTTTEPGISAHAGDPVDSEPDEKSKPIDGDAPASKPAGLATSPQPSTTEPLGQTQTASSQ